VFVGGSAGLNCVGAVNATQLDSDLDGMGDVCDLDQDNDGVLNTADNCSLVSNRAQLDDDGDALGDLCDAKYCVVIDPNNKGDCLDPNGPFRVHGGGLVMLKAGEKFRLPLFANRNGAAIEYVWTVKQRPDGSKAAVINPEGVVTLSRHWEYAYPDGSVPSFTADVDGEFELQLQAKLVFADRAYPANRDSTSSLKLNASPDSGASGCSTGVDLSLAALGMGLLLAGYPDTVAGLTVNRFCASGLQAVAQAADRIRLGAADVMIAGGCQQNSPRCPWNPPATPQRFAWIT
jgi:hypothetical protein